MCSFLVIFLYHTMFTLFFSTVVWISGTIIRRLRVDAMAEEKLTCAEKAHLRLIRRVRRALEEAVASLARAKRGHDALEAIYRPCVDFDAVNALCETEIARLTAYLP